MAQTGQQAVESILKLTVDYQEGIKAVGSYMAEIKKLKDEQKDLNQQFKDGTITEKQYGDAMAANKTVTKQLDTEMKVLTTEIRKKLEADRADQKQIEINTASYNKLAETYKIMKQRINEMSAAEREQNKAYIQQSKQVYERMKQLQAETGKMQLNVGNYQQAITMAITGNSRFASSLMGLTSSASTASGALGIVNQNAMAAAQAMSTLLANPVFLAIAGIAGAGMAFKFWKDYNEGIAEANRLTRQFTNTTGAELNEIRSSVQAIADTFGKDFKEVMSAADKIVENYGITWDESLNTIAKGFAAGADMNGDMLAKIERFGPVLKDAGLSVEQMVALLQQTRTGIFGEDGLNLIAKAGKSLRDMSSSTEKALEGIGIRADEMQRKLANGSIDMFQAIQQVSEHLKGVSTNSQEAGAAMDAIFGKQAVMAGQEQVKAIADLEMELDKLTEQEGAYGAELLKSYELQVELNKVTFALLGTDGWEESQLKVKNFGKAIALFVLTNVYKCVNAAIDLWNIIKMMSNGSVNLFGATIATLWSGWKHFVGLIGDSLSSLGDSMKGFGDIIAGVFTFDADKIIAGWNKVTGGLKGAWQSAVISFSSFGSQAAANFANAWNRTISTEKTKHKELPNITLSDVIDNNVDPDPTSPTSPTPKGGNSSSNTNNDAEKAEKERQRLLKEQQRAQEAAAKAELALRQKVIQSRLALIKKGSQEEMQLRLEALEQERLLAIERIEQENKDVENQALVQELILNTNKDYLNKRKAIYDEFEKSERERQEQAIANTFTERLMANANNELEQERIRLEQLQYMRDNARKQEGESEEAFKARLLELDNEVYEKRKDIAEKEIAIQKAKAEAMGNIMGAISDMFDTLGEKNRDSLIVSKVLAIAEIAIQQGIAIAHAVRDAASGSHSVWEMIAQIAVGIATVTASIKQAIDSVNSAKFARGGLITGPGTGTSDSITAKVSNGESVMTASATALFSPLLSALNQLGGGVPIVQTGVHAQLGEDMLAAAIAKGYAMAPSPVVSVKEITDVGNRVKVIEQMSMS